MKNLIKSLAALALLGFPLSVAGFRLNLIGFGTSYQIISWAVYLSVALLVLGIVIFFWKRSSDPELAKVSLISGLLMLLPVAGLGSQAVTASSVPPIHNISTDTVNPPAFDKVVAKRTAENNPLEYKAAELAEVQNAAYPNVKTLYTELPVPDAHARALELIEANGWELVNDDPENGIIEATDTTLLWGFKDDVVIRITEQQYRRAVDMRSVSRIGRSDLGANARRIEKFLQEFEKQ